MNESSSIYGGNGVSGRWNELGFAKHIRRPGTLALLMLMSIHVLALHFILTVLTPTHLVSQFPPAVASFRSSSDTLNHLNDLQVQFFHNAFLT